MWAYFWGGQHSTHHKILLTCSYTWENRASIRAGHLSIDAQLVGGRAGPGHRLRSASCSPYYRALWNVRRDQADRCRTVPNNPDRKALLCPQRALKVSLLWRWLLTEASAWASGGWQSDVSVSVSLAQCRKCLLNETECLWEDTPLTCPRTFIVSIVCSGWECLGAVGKAVWDQSSLWEVQCLSYPPSTWGTSGRSLCLAFQVCKVFLQISLGVSVMLILWGMCQDGGSVLWRQEEVQDKISKPLPALGFWEKI